MKCAWKELLSILPMRIRGEVDAGGKETLQELRLRINAPPEMVCSTGVSWLKETITQDDLNFVVNAATRYSPWAASSPTWSGSRSAWPPSRF